MKNQEQDQLAEFIREAKPLSPSADFTELLMEQIDPAFSLEQDELTVGLRDERKELRLSPSMDFSDELMERLSGPRVSKRIYGAVRPRRVWTGVGMIASLLIVLAFIPGSEPTQTTMWLPGLTALLNWSVPVNLVLSCFLCGGVLLGLDYFF